MIESKNLNFAQKLVLQQKIEYDHAIEKSNHEFTNRVQLILEKIKLNALESARYGNIKNSYSFDVERPGGIQAEKYLLFVQTELSKYGFHVEQSWNCFRPCESQSNVYNSHGSSCKIHFKVSWSLN